jgi:hypothetical protein
MGHDDAPASYDEFPADTDLVPGDESGDADDGDDNAVD